MPQTRHVERHFTSGEIVRDIVIGMSDGLTVPFALAAGLSGAVASTGIIVTAGLARSQLARLQWGLADTSRRRAMRSITRANAQESKGRSRRFREKK